jgi:SAM-dependent methyltransferase
MGIGVHERALLEREQPLGDVLTLGRQRLNIAGVGRGRYADDLLTALGASSVQALDYSDFEGATYTGDLNAPIDLGRQFDTVIDFGTSEHIFNIAESLRNCIRLCKVGGRILHSQPANGDCGHGFYQLSPELFLALYSERNGFSDTELFLYDLLDPKHWWRFAPQGPVLRSQTNSIAALYCLVRTTKTAEVERVEALQDFYEEAWEASEELEVGGRWDSVLRVLNHAPVLRQVGAALYRGFLAPTAVTRFNRNLTRQQLPRPGDMADSTH